MSYYKAASNSSEGERKIERTLSLPLQNMPLWVVNYFKLPQRIYIEDLLQEGVITTENYSLI